MAKKIKKYEIKSFEQLINLLSDENIDILSIDLMQWLYMYLKAIKIFREKDPDGTKGKRNWDILPGWFIWHDDGKNEQKGFQFHNSETGEILEIKPKLSKQKEMTAIKNEILTTKKEA